MLRFILKRQSGGLSTLDALLLYSSPMPQNGMASEYRSVTEGIALVFFLLWSNMPQELVTRDERLSRLREEGIEGPADLKRAFIARDGHFSVKKKGRREFPRRTWSFGPRKMLGASLASCSTPVLLRAYRPLDRPNRRCRRTWGRALPKSVFTSPSYQALPKP